MKSSNSVPGVRSQSRVAVMTSLVFLAVSATTSFASAQGFSLNKQLDGGSVRPKVQLSKEARARLDATIISNTLSIAFARYACADLTPEACLEHLPTLESDHHPQFAQVSLEKWDVATKEISQALERLKSNAKTPTALMINEKPEVWKTLFNASIVVRLAVGKFQEQVSYNPELLVPEKLRNLRAPKGIDRLELHHQLVFFGEKVYIGHKAINRTGDDLKAHRLINQTPLVEVDLSKEDQLGELVVTRIKASMVHFGQALSR
jgi:hypothetical protein